MSELIFFANPLLLPLVLVVVLTLAIEFPFRFARAWLPDEVVDKDSWNTVQAGLITLAAFVLSLSFSQASARFDVRRELVVKEANAIGTTWLRADQLPSAQAKRFRQILTDYTAKRLESDETPEDQPAFYEIIRQANLDQDRLWAIVSPALREHPYLGLSLLMQTLNDTIDVSGEQVQALIEHVPTAILTLMLLLLTLAMLSTGIRFARDRSRPVFLSTLFVFACVVVVSMVVDYDRPQSGFVKVDLRPMQVQLASMREAP
jgi:hypothetical protein